MRGDGSVSLDSAVADAIKAITQAMHRRVTSGSIVMAAVNTASRRMAQGLGVSSGSNELLNSVEMQQS